MYVKACLLIDIMRVCMHVHVCIRVCVCVCGEHGILGPIFQLTRLSLREGVSMVSHSLLKTVQALELRFICPVLSMTNLSISPGPKHFRVVGR